MTLLSAMRSPALTLFQTGMSLLLSAVALLSPHWCEGKQKVLKPLCSRLKTRACVTVPGLPNSSHFSWETGDDRFVFPSFHSGLWTSCQEDIYLDKWEEKCHSFMALTPPSEKVMLWLSVAMELANIGLLGTSAVLLGLQMCARARLPSAARWGLLCNAFSAIFTVLGGLLGMVGHMMFMEVFQVTASRGQEGFKPHRYGYSWAFYVAWAAFSLSMSSGVTTLNSYTKDVLMRRHTCTEPTLPDAAVEEPVQLPSAPFYSPLQPLVPPPSPPFPPPSPSVPPPSLPLPPPSPPVPPCSRGPPHTPPLSPHYKSQNDPPLPPPASPSSCHYPSNMLSPFLSQTHSNLICVPQYSDSCDSL